MIALPLRINIVTLGCPKNTVDSEKLAALLTEHGFVVYFDLNTRCDVVIINTCGFINDAKQQSLDSILSWESLRKKRYTHLLVMGCLSQRYSEELKSEIFADAWFGVNDHDHILKKILSFYSIDKSAGQHHSFRMLSTPAHYAYLKISEGCSRRCSFCAIPGIRGAHVSVPSEELIAEAGELAAKGVKELIVIAQDTTFYGMDLYGKRSLAALLEKLSLVRGIEWIRLHYTFPADFPDDVAEIMAGCDKICKYMDMPLQHINDDILKSMRRQTGKNKTLQLLEKLRKKIPELSLRTAFITGYPGESPGAFNELYEFVRQQRFERAGVFAFSPEEGTAAYSMQNTPSEAIALKRADKLMELQQQISLELNQQKIGKSLKVIIDRKENDIYIGRTEADSPDIDNEVIINSKTKLEMGDFYNIRITYAEEFDLYGEPQDQ